MLRILNGFSRTIGISAAPGYRVFLSSGQDGRVTPADEHIITCNGYNIKKECRINTKWMLNENEKLK